VDIPSNISLPVSSDNTLFNLFNCYLESFDGDIPLSEYIDVFEKDDTKFDIYLKTHKYLGEDIYTLSSVVLNTDVVTLTKKLTNGQNNYNPFEDIPDGVSYSVPISSSSLTDIGATAGTKLSNSDVIWQFVDGVVEGAWLKRSDEEFISETACIRLPRGVTEFKFPYADKGLSGEGVNWTGKGIDNCYVTPYISQEERELSKYIETTYWDDVSELSSMQPIALNQTQLVNTTAQSSKIIEEADRILIRSTKDANDSELAWLFNFDRTELPISCGTNVIYYPLFRLDDPEGGVMFNIFPDQAESKPLSSINIIKSMCGAIAGLTPDDSDQILKQSGQCENPTEGAWLRSCELSSIDIDGTTMFTEVLSCIPVTCLELSVMEPCLSAIGVELSSMEICLSSQGFDISPTTCFDLSSIELCINSFGFELSSMDICTPCIDVFSGGNGTRQTGIHMVNRSGDVSNFFWEFDDLDATLAINGYDHDSHCGYLDIDKYSSIINPTVSDEINQWKKCNCKAVNYSPIGNPLGNYESYREFSDVIYVDSGIEPFSLATWEDLEGNDYKNSDQFAVFNYNGILSGVDGRDMEPDAGYGIGYWETLNGNPLILKKGNSYVYRRASFGGCDDVTAPPFVMNNCHCYDKANDNICRTEWVKMVREDDGSWESTGEVTDMTLDSGSFYQYIKKGSIKYQIYKQGEWYDKFTETPSFSLNIPFEESKPYWASSPNLFGLSVGISAFETDSYLLTTQPKPSEIILTDDIYMQYTSNGCDPIIWNQDLNFSIDLDIPNSWRKIVFSDETPELLRKIIGCGSCELVFPDTPNTCAIRENRCDSFFTSIKAIDEPSDLLLRSPINCDETTQFFYYATEGFSWEQEFTNVTNADDALDVSLFSTASKPWGNLLNTNDALIRVHEKNEILKTKYELGIFKPELVGLNKIECFGIQNEIL
jgi:hypothetical protein